MSCTICIVQDSIARGTWYSVIQRWDLSKRPHDPRRGRGIGDTPRKNALPSCTVRDKRDITKTRSTHSFAGGEICTRGCSAHGKYRICQAQHWYAGNQVLTHGIPGAGIIHGMSRSGKHGISGNSTRDTRYWHHTRDTR